MNKILVKIYFPLLEEKFDVWIPVNKKIYSIIRLMVKNVYGIENIKELNNMPFLYNKYTGTCYEINSKISDTDIKNGAELILI